eukprot:168271-Pyramimonas_sp.AAC.2
MGKLHSFSNPNPINGFVTRARPDAASLRQIKVRESFLRRGSPHKSPLPQSTYTRANEQTSNYSIPHSVFT